MLQGSLENQNIGGGGGFGGMVQRIDIGIYL